MGDRAIVQFYDNGYNFSPLVYLHRHRTKVTTFFDRLDTLMEGRRGDIEYSCARFIGICHENISGNLSLSVFNASSRLFWFSKDRNRIISENYLIGENRLIVNSSLFMYNVDTLERKEYYHYGL